MYTLTAPIIYMHLTNNLCRDYSIAEYSYMDCFLEKSHHNRPSIIFKFI